MSVSITKTRDISEGAIEELAQAISDCAVPIERRELLHKALGETPSFVTVLSDILSWKTMLGIPTTVFISQLARNAADDIYKNKTRIAEVLSQRATKPLKRISAALRKTVGTSPRKSVVRIGIPFPDDFLGTYMVLEVQSEEQVAVELAFFVVNIEAIQNTVKNEVLPNGEPRGGVIVQRKEYEAYILKWRGEDGHPREFTIEIRL